MAEGILQYKCDNQNLDWEIDSAGTGGWHSGEPPHKKAQKIAKLHGVDISHLHARQFVKEDMQRFDKIYAMDSENYIDIKRIVGNLWDESKVDLILNQSSPEQDLSVPDPWYENTDAAFEQTFQLLDKACEQLLKNEQ